jgi:hypothetical protein
MIGFQLWREWRLSIAEILAVFGDVEIINYASDFLVIDWLSKEKAIEKAQSLWWTIKIMEVLSLENISWRKNIRYCNLNRVKI